MSALDDLINFFDITAKETFDPNTFPLICESAGKELAQLRAENEQKDKALELIGDITVDRDGYTGNADALVRLIDEVYDYARNPEKAARICDDATHPKEEK